MDRQCFARGGQVAEELKERVMLERVEMIARLTAEGVCRERDREIALDLIAEITRENLVNNNYYSFNFSTIALKNKIRK